MRITAGCIVPEVFLFSCGLSTAAPSRIAAATGLFGELGFQGIFQFPEQDFRDPFQLAALAVGQMGEGAIGQGFGLDWSESVFR